MQDRAGVSTAARTAAGLNAADNLSSSQACGPGAWYESEPLPRGFAAVHVPGPFVFHPRGSYALPSA